MITGLRLILAAAVMFTGLAAAPAVSSAQEAVGVIHEDRPGPTYDPLVIFTVTRLAGGKLEVSLPPRSVVMLRLD